MVSVKQVGTRTEWKAFLRLPWRIYRDHPQWVPPLLSDQKKQLDPDHGTFFRDGHGSTAGYFLAFRDGEPVGRIAAIANELHRATHHDGVGFFGFFESVDDPEVAGPLLERANEWLAEKGFHLSRGPTSFTIYDPAGVTVFGGDLRPGMGMAYTPAYYSRLLEGAGYRKVRDLLAYRFTSSCFDPWKLYSRVESFGARSEEEFEIRSLRKKDASDAEIIARIFNRAWEKNWGAIPMTADDFLHIQEEMGPFADERLVYLASRGGEPVAFFIASLDPGEILQSMNGRITPRGLFKILLRRDQLTQMRVILMGVLPEYRNSSVVVRLLMEFYRHWKDFPAVESFEFSWILEDNLPIRNLVEGIGGIHSHTFRVFEKFI